MYDVVFGLKSGDDTKFLHHEKGRHKEDKPLLRGDDIRRYGYDYKGEYVWYVPKRMTAHRKTARPGDAVRFEQPKVIVKDTTTDFSCTYEGGDYYLKDVLIVVPKQDVLTFDLRFVAAVINSKALRFYYRTTFKTVHVQNGELASLPLPPMNGKAAAAKKVMHDRLVTLVDQMLTAVKQRAAAVTDSDASYYENRCRDLDRQIDGLVSELYGLSKDDCRLIDKVIEENKGISPKLDPD